MLDPISAQSFPPSRGQHAAPLPLFPLDNNRYNDYIRSMPARFAVPLEDQLFVAILKIADSLSQEAEQVIKSAGLTSA